MERALFSARCRSEFSLLVKLGSLLTICLLAASCVAAKPAPVAPRVEVLEAPRQTQEEDVEHVISVNGETLGIIAKWYTGDSKNWPAISKANNKLVPEKLRLGQVIVIPRGIVTERGKMTSDFVSKEVRSIKKTVLQKERVDTAPQDGGANATSVDAAKSILERSKNGFVAGISEVRDGLNNPEAAQPAQQQSPPSPPVENQLLGQNNAVPVNVNPANNTIKQEMKLQKEHSEVKGPVADEQTVDEETLERERLLKELLGK